MNLSFLIKIKNILIIKIYLLLYFQVDKKFTYI